MGYSHFKVKRLVEFYELLFHGIVYSFIFIQEVSVTHHEFVWILTLFLFLSSLLSSGWWDTLYNLQQCSYLEFKSKELNAQISYGDNSFTVRLS